MRSPSLPARLLVASLTVSALGCGDVTLLAAGSEGSTASSTGGGGGGAGWTTSSTSSGEGGGEGGGASPCAGGGWAKRFGGDEDQSAEALVVDASCNLYLAATTTGTIDLGNGPLQGKLYTGTTLAKIAPSGEAIWSRWLESNKAPIGIAALALDPGGNLVMTGVFQGTFDFGAGPVKAGDKSGAYVAKLDPQGKLLWERHFDVTVGFNMRGSTLAVTQTGEVVMTVSFIGTADFGDGAKPSLGEDIAVLKLDGAGETIWVRRFGGPGNTLDQVTNLALGPAGEIAIAGDYEGTLDLGAGPLPFAWSEGFLGVLGADGQTLYSMAIPEALCGYNDCPLQLAFDAAGKLSVAGPKLDDPMSPDPMRVVFRRVLGPTGAIEQSMVVEGRSVQAIATGDDGALWLVGEVGGKVLSRLDPDGKVGWSRGQLSVDNLTDYDAGGRVLAIDPGGSLLVAGSFRGSVDFGEGAMTSAGKRDLFLARVPPP